MPRTSRRDPKPEPVWRDLIARWKTSGQTVAAFCAAHLGEAGPLPSTPFRGDGPRR
jgi:hypothetical protein